MRGVVVPGSLAGSEGDGRHGLRKGGERAHLPVHSLSCKHLMQVQMSQPQPTQADQLCLRCQDGLPTIYHAQCIMLKQRASHRPTNVYQPSGAYDVRLYDFIKVHVYYYINGYSVSLVVGVRQQSFGRARYESCGGMGITKYRHRISSPTKMYANASFNPQETVRAGTHSDKLRPTSREFVFPRRRGSNLTIPR